MLTLVKDEKTKFVDSESSLLPQLKADGWKVEGDVDNDDDADIDDLKAKADALGIEYRANIGAKTLAARIAEAE